MFRRSGSSATKPRHSEHATVVSPLGIPDVDGPLGLGKLLDKEELQLRFERVPRVDVARPFFHEVPDAAAGRQRIGEHATCALAPSNRRFRGRTAGSLDEVVVGRVLGP